MKLLRRDLDKESGGSLSLIPEESEDMWHLFNLVQIDDSVQASTIRKVTTESSTGSTTSNRIRTTLTLVIEHIDYDSSASVLRLRGRNVVENAHVKLGAYHTIDLEANRKVVLHKQCWDSVSLERIELATDLSKSADVFAIIMQDGLANLCLVSNAMTVTKAKIDVNIPRKRRGHNAQHEKGLQKFYDNVLQALIRHVNFDVVKVVLLASPGFVNQRFFDYVMQEAVKNDIKVLLENKPKFVLVHASSGFKHALKEVLQDPAVQSRLTETKAVLEVRALDSFFKTLEHDPSRACYGLKHILAAVEAGAIDTLLISDRLFRAREPQERLKHVKMVDDVRASGGEVRLFSSLHVTGEQLDNLTGVAAILRFPMDELEEASSSSGDSSDDEVNNLGE